MIVASCTPAPSAAPPVGPSTAPSSAPSPVPSIASPVPSGTGHSDAETATIVQVLDGDTLDARIGSDVARIRLVQIDAPEVIDPAECHGREAAAALTRLASRGSVVRLEADERLDHVDRHGRLLRYVFDDGTNLNLRLVEIGAAAPYFYRGERGRYATELLEAAQVARSSGAGLWGACPGAVFDPDRALDAGPEGG